MPSSTRIFLKFDCDVLLGLSWRFSFSELTNRIGEVRGVLTDRTDNTRALVSVGVTVEPLNTKLDTNRVLYCCRRVTLVLYKVFPRSLSPLAVTKAGFSLSWILCGLLYL
jgi:hypothetical protein